MSDKQLQKAWFKVIFIQVSLQGDEQLLGVLDEGDEVRNMFQSRSSFGQYQQKAFDTVGHGKFPNFHHLAHFP